MDSEHEGRWKKYDPDVLKEGDIESDSEYSDSSETEESESENGEVYVIRGLLAKRGRVKDQ